MSDRLRDLRVLALDCQAAGATPAHGDLLELGWGVCSASGLLRPVRSHWVAPRRELPVPRAVRELTGWSERVLSEALEEGAAFQALRAECADVAASGSASWPTVIHYAQFELAFLRDAHARRGAEGDFPYDVVCLHAIAARLLPDLPRRSIRALAGYFGHSAELVRRASGHVEATASIWAALVPRLEASGIDSWSELKAWLARSSRPPRPKKRAFPLSIERRRALPDAPGVYRFRRSNGDVLYVGKATSLKRRVASHFKSTGPTSERALELLTQVHELEHTETPSLLEAALLESDEIKRLEPPYNVQLRAGSRCAWFASRDFRETVPGPDPEHPLGPLPSERGVAPLSALIALLEGARPAGELVAAALGVPSRYVPEPALFCRGFSELASTRLNLAPGDARARVLAAARELWLERGRREEPEPENDGAETDAPDTWDLARVRRRLERHLVQAGLLVRRARWLRLLANATAVFREPDSSRARALVFSAGEVSARHELEHLQHARLAAHGLRPAGVAPEFDAASYDRLRVLFTELRRVQAEGGEIALLLRRHWLAGMRLKTLLADV